MERINKMNTVIVGAGTYGTVYLYYLKEAGYNIKGFLDDNKKLWGSDIEGTKVLGGINLLNRLKEENIEAVFCPLGNNDLRVRILSEAKVLGYKTPNYIHPSVQVPKNTIIGEGVYILSGVQLMPHVKLEDYVMVSMAVNIAHHSTLKRGTFVSTGVNYGASILAEEKSYIGIGATIMTGLNSLGKGCLIGAGAVVTKDVPAKAIVVGVPAKIIKYKS